MNVIPIFPLALCVDNVSLPDISFIKEIDYEQLANGKGYQSISRQILNTPEFSSLKSIIQNTVEKYIYTEINISRKINIRITNSWVVKMEAGDWGMSHYHDHSLFSGVLYLNVDESSSSIRFNKPQNINQMGNPPIITVPFDDDAKWNIFNSTGWTFQPKTGDIIIFPSHLQHEVTENKSNQTRYSLAFNTFVSGTLGEQDGELTL